MKNLILMTSLLLSLSAGATEIQVRNGESLTVINSDCKTSEYTSVERFSAVNTFTASCKPKVCETRSYLRMDGWHMSVTLKPGDKLLLDADSREEGLNAVTKFIADGICAIHGKYIPRL